jgi:hypothetical protein
MIFIRDKKEKKTEQNKKKEREREYLNNVLVE